MNIKLDIYEVIDSLRQTGHLPKNFKLEETHVSLPIPDRTPKGRRKDTVTWSTEMLCEDCSDIEFFGYMD